MTRDDHRSTLDRRIVSPNMKRGLTRLCLLLLVGEAVCSAQTWPQFRGEHAGVASDDPSLPDTWSETQNIAWKIDIPGRGWSSPVVWGDHVFVTTAVNVLQPKQDLLRPEAYRGASMGGTMSRRDLDLRKAAPGIRRWHVLGVAVVVQRQDLRFE